MLKGCNELTSRVLSQVKHCLTWNKCSAHVSFITHAIAVWLLVGKCGENASFSDLPHSVESQSRDLLSLCPRQLEDPQWQVVGTVARS